MTGASKCMRVARCMILSLATLIALTGAAFSQEQTSAITSRENVLSPDGSFKGGVARQTIKTLCSYDDQHRLTKKIHIIDNYYFDASMQAMGFKPNFSATFDLWDYEKGKSVHYKWPEVSADGRRADRKMLLEIASAENLSISFIESLRSADSKLEVRWSVLTDKRDKKLIEKMTYFKRDDRGVFVPKMFTLKPAAATDPVRYLVNPAFANDIEDVSKHKAVVSHQLVVARGLVYDAFSCINARDWTIQWTFADISQNTKENADSISKQVWLRGSLFHIDSSPTGVMTLTPAPRSSVINKTPL